MLVGLDPLPPLALSNLCKDFIVSPPISALSKCFGAICQDVVQGARLSTDCSELVRLFVDKTTLCNFPEPELLLLFPQCP